MFASRSTPACGYVDESASLRTGPSRAVWTTPGPRRKLGARRRGYHWRGPQVDHTLGPLAHIPTGSTTNCFQTRIEEECYETSCQQLTGQNISADYLAILLASKWIIAACVAIGAACGYAKFLTSDLIYSASALMQLQGGLESSVAGLEPFADYTQVLKGSAGHPFFFVQGFHARRGQWLGGSVQCG